MVNPEAKCHLCGNHIDLSACDQQNAMITIHTDNDEDCKVLHMRLCDDCTASLRLWIAKQALGRQQT